MKEVKNSKATMQFVALLSLSICLAVESRADRQVVFVAPAAGTGHEEELDLLLTLDAGLQDWLESLDFAGAYEYRQWTADGFEMALSDNHDGSPESTGFIAKGLGMLRYSVRPTAKMVASERSKQGAVEVQNAPYDEVSSDEIALSYLPKLAPSANYGEAVFLGRKSLADKAARYESGVRSSGRISPLSLMGDPPGSDFRVPDGAEGVTIMVKEDETNESIRTVALGYRFQQCDYDKYVEVDLSTEYPLIKSVTMMLDFGDKGKGEIRAKCDKLVDCNGLTVATVVRRAIHYGSGSPVLVTEWRSTDLGKRSPTKNDFLIPVDENTKIKGLQTPMKALHNGKLDISLVSSADLSVPGFPAKHRPEDLASDVRTSPFLIWVNIAVIVVLTLFVGLRLRTRCRQVGKA